ncbi:MAG: FAD assembly factor SdhE [Chromatiales bacterium]
MATMIPDKQIRWRCRRGIKELEVLLERFLASAYSTLSEPEKCGFGRLLEEKDPDLLGWLSGRAQPEDRVLAAIVQRIRTAVDP